MALSLLHLTEAPAKTLIKQKCHGPARTSFIGATAGGTGTPGPLDGDVREIVAYGGIAHSEAERFKISIALAYKAAI